MSSKSQGSISEVISAAEAQNSAMMRQKKAKGRLEAELNALLIPVRIDHNRKGLPRLKVLRVRSIKMAGRKIAVSAEAIIAGRPIFATEEAQIFRRLRNKLCPQIKSAFKGFDARVKVDKRLRIYHRGARGYLGNFEEGD